MVFTDPPYGVAIGSKNAAIEEATGVQTKSIKEDIANDTLGVDELYKVLQRAMENVRLNCKDDASYYVCAPPGGDMGLMMMMMKDAGLAVRHQIVWNKSAATFSLGRLDYDYKHEAIMYTWTKKHHNYRKGAMRTSVWDVAGSLWASIRASSCSRGLRSTTSGRRSWVPTSTTWSCI